MNDMVKLILSLSLSGSILAGCMLLLRPVIKQKISKSVQYYIWLIILLRFLLPFSFEGSIMNKLFYVQQTPVSQAQVEYTNKISQQQTTNASLLTTVQEQVTNGAYDKDSDHNRYLTDLLNQYFSYFWFFGFLLTMGVNIISYMLFLHQISSSYKPVTEEEFTVLKDLNTPKVKFMRNRLINTPMLIGIIRPIIVIPDGNFTKEQLKNILLHELTHLKRYDIAVKWLTMLIVSLHWYNPLMYFIRKEINNLGELSCDEAVITKLKTEEKQAYGETLIAVAAESSYSNGVLQATMHEDKKVLKERLLAIMHYDKKSTTVKIFSGLLFFGVLLGALYLGAGVGRGTQTNILAQNPPNIYISTEYEKTKEAIIGSYSWKTLWGAAHADSIHPLDFKYQENNIVSVSAHDQLVIGTEKRKIDINYPFSLDKLLIFKDGKVIKPETVEPSFLNGQLYLQAPAEPGEYIYELRLNYQEKGIVSYGFLVRVDTLTYNLEKIADYNTPYIGNHSKVIAIASQLPLLDKYFRQQYISMNTKVRPYGLTVYYEAAEKTEYPGNWPLSKTDSTMQENLSKNALVLFCMIGNLDEVTFAFRRTQSTGQLEKSKYVSTFTYQRKTYEEKYGDLTRLGDNLQLLDEKLSN